MFGGEVRSARMNYSGTPVPRIVRVALGKDGPWLRTTLGPGTLGAAWLRTEVG